MEKIRVIVNAIPLVNIKTGIGRYIQSLYTVMERKYGDEFEFIYFDGKEGSSHLPSGVPDLARWNTSVALFWKLPWQAALPIRIGLLKLREKRFAELAQGADIYHETAFFPFLPPPGVAVLFTLHDLSLIRHPRWHPKERVHFFNRYFFKRLGLVDAFVAVSDFTRQEMATLCDLSPHRTTVTPLAHEDSIFFPRSRESIAAVLHKFGIAERYFLFVGTNDPRKNIYVIPQALELADCGEKIVVAGWDGWGDYLPDSAILTGYVSDEELACLYSGATGLVYPSIYEGFGLPLAEAMACGCPVVTTRAASLPEVAGEAGLYMDSPRDARSLSSALDTLALDKSIRRRAREMSLEQASKFSWERTADLTRKALLNAYEAKRKK